MRTPRVARPAQTSAPAPSETSALFEGQLGCSIDEGAKALGLHRDTIYQLIAKGELTASKIGQRTLVHTASIIALMDRTRVTFPVRAKDASTFPVRTKRIARRDDPA
jgi:excisionase family DNA binding protein